MTLTAEKREGEPVAAAEQPVTKKAKTEADTANGVPKEDDVPEYMKTQLAIVAMTTKNMDESVKHWMALTGYTKGLEMPGGYWTELDPPKALLDKGAPRLAFSPECPPEQIKEGDEFPKAGQLTFCYTTSDLDAYHEKVKEMKDITVLAKPAKQPWGGYMARYKSGEGVLFSVMIPPKEVIMS